MQTSQTTRLTNHRHFLEDRFPNFGRSDSSGFDLVASEPVRGLKSGVLLKRSPRVEYWIRSSSQGRGGKQTADIGARGGRTVDRRRKASSSWRWTAEMETTDPPPDSVGIAYICNPPFPGLRPRKSLIFEQGSVFHPMSLRLTRCLLTWNSFGPR